MSNNKRVFWFCWCSAIALYFSVLTIADMSTSNVFGWVLNGFVALGNLHCASEYMSSKFEEKYGI